MSSSRRLRRKIENLECFVYTLECKNRTLAMQNRDLGQKIKRLEEDKGEEKSIPREENDTLKSHVSEMWTNLDDQTKTIFIDFISNTERGKEAWERIEDYHELLNDHNKLRKEVDEFAQHLQNVMMPGE
ncbi:MAG: hypothetical protein CL916_03225 [Deltaproteobacteria bacterium]|nr:hypothetical protein [Deltaproteobacteria bacterium]